MKKIYSLFAAVLVTLALCVPTQNAQAQLHYASTFGELYSLLGQGYDITTGESAIDENDVVRIRLTSNIEFDDSEGHVNYLYVNRTCMLDLNGHTLKKTSYRDDNNFAILMNSNSCLDINDYSQGGNGKIIHNNFQSSTARFSSVIYSAGETNVTVKLNSGSLIATQNNQVVLNDTKACTAVMFDKGPDGFTKGSFYMYGGYVSSLGNFTRGINQDLQKNEYFFMYLYGGTIGSASTMSSVSAFYPIETNNTGMAFGYVKQCTVYGLKTNKSFFKSLFPNPNIKVYINDVLTPSSTYLNAATNAYANSKVEVRYEPSLTVGGIEVTRDNCDDIMPWEEFRISFDYSSEDLYLESLGTNEVEVLNGNIIFENFNLGIHVKGRWTVNGSIIGHGGALNIWGKTYSGTEEDANLLVLHSSDAPCISLNGEDLYVKYRLKLMADDNSTNSQSVIKCGKITIDDSWLMASGKNPVVECSDSFLANTQITLGSFSNNDIVKVEPLIKKYVISVMANNNDYGSVSGTGYGAYNVYDGVINYQYNYLASATLQATPNSGYHFERWGDGSTDNPYTFWVIRDNAYTAIFAPDVEENTYTVNFETSDPNLGQVGSSISNCPEGSVINLVATPQPGCELMYWTSSSGANWGKMTQWTVTKDETFTAHFRETPSYEEYNLWVCGERVTSQNQTDILGDGVWAYDHANRVLSTMKMASYNIENDGFIQDYITNAGPMTVYFDHSIDVVCTTTDNVARSAIASQKGMTMTGHTWMGFNLTAQNMYAAQFMDIVTITGHIWAQVYLQNTTEWGRTNIQKAILLSNKTPALVVNGALFECIAGVGESNPAYKVTNRTDQSAALSLVNAEIEYGSISDFHLSIEDVSPQYSLNYYTPSLFDICQVGSCGQSYFEGTLITLRADVSEGYKFVRWSDGNEENPRFFFMPAENIQIDPIVAPDIQDSYGAIINASTNEGGSIQNFQSGWYEGGTEISLYAVPSRNMVFSHWSDGTTDNPYNITVKECENVNIVALFSDSDGIGESESTTLSVMPNPANNVIFVNGLDGNEQVNVYDILGQVVKSARLNNGESLSISDLSAGIYMLCSEKSAQMVKFTVK